MAVRKRRVDALSRARSAYLASNRGNAALRTYLTAKARLGHFDVRMMAYYGLDTRVNAGCRAAVCRAFAAHLVPTSTTGGVHAPGSWHGRRDANGDGHAVDFGLRSNLVGTAAGTRRLAGFQRAERTRYASGKLPRLVELIGPVNTLAILRGRPASLAEGAPLETMHDNHVHEAYAA